MSVHDDRSSPADSPEQGPDRTAPPFDEALYLRAFPDVTVAIEQGQITSGLDHYRMAGQAEGRLTHAAYLREFEAVMGPPPRVTVDSPLRAPCGAMLIVGWTDDQEDALTEIIVDQPGVRPRPTGAIARLRRPDVEAAVGGTMINGASLHPFGFWAFAGPDPDPSAHESNPEDHCPMQLCFRSGKRQISEQRLEPVSNVALMTKVLDGLARAEYHGDRLIETFAILDGGMGDQIVALNRMITQSITSRAIAERFGPKRSKLLGSIIVPIEDRRNPLFVQARAFSMQAGSDAYEFIYVINNPDLIEPLCREAHIAAQTYGVSITLVMYPGNAGFACANNIAAGFAGSKRLLFVSPDILPRAPDWARTHARVIADRPGHETRLFGPRLYHGDGSVTDGGLYLDVEKRISGHANGITRRSVLRVEPLETNAPIGITQGTSQPTSSRPVLAITDAFISMERGWFERLNGFSEDYVGHGHADADLCLRSLAAGTVAWTHDLPMWHLGGRITTQSPAQDGGSLVDRWLFSRAWQPVLGEELLGPTPNHPLLAVTTEPPAQVTTPERPAPSRSRRAAPARTKSGAGA